MDTTRFWGQLHNINAQDIIGKWSDRNSSLLILGNFLDFIVKMAIAATTSAQHTYT